MKICEHCSHSRYLELSQVRICAKLKGHPHCAFIDDCEYRPETNGEHIRRSMTDAVLADMISGEYPMYKNRCTMCVNASKRICHSSECVSGIVKWLEMPYKEQDDY